MERCVDIPVSKELRDEIKKLKNEKTYEQFLVNLINQKKDSSSQRQPGGKTT